MIRCQPRVLEAGETMLVHARRGEPVERLSRGTPVEVRCPSLDGWVHGFEVADHHQGDYLLRRLSDRVILPVHFDAHDVRAHS